MTVIDRVADLLPRPLDPVRSVKLKISILLVASGGAGLVYLWFQYRWLPPTVISVATFAIVLLTAQVLAHGMTRPLRAMTAAARAMAQGDYSRRVRATSRDEVGQLAVAFNQMAADLAADQERRGFWQLLAVTALALGVLAFDSRWAPHRTPQERAVKRGLLAALAVLTLVVVASAIHWMWLYQQAYGFTVLRLLVLTCELWPGAGFLIALVAVLRLRPAGLRRPMVAAGVIGLLGLAAVDPDRLIAEHNIARWAETGQLDTYYLSTLSADAVPALIALPEPERSCALARIADGLGDGLGDGDDWRGTNFSRAAARDVLGPLAPSCDDGRS
jgi:HAMP domain-containing protein